MCGWPQVIHAAIFDLLTSQCDRHTQNIFISESVGWGGWGVEGVGGLREARAHWSDRAAKLGYKRKGEEGRVC